MALDSCARCNVTAFEKVVLQYLDRNVPCNDRINPWEVAEGIKAQSVFLG